MGSEVDYEESQQGVVKLAPKPGRVSKVVGLCSEALEKDSLPVLSARSLGGVLRFLREGHFGRTGATVLKALSDHVQLGVEKGLQRDLRDGLEWVLCFLPIAPPR